MKYEKRSLASFLQFLYIFALRAGKHTTPPLILSQMKQGARGGETKGPNKGSPAEKLKSNIVCNKFFHSHKTILIFLRHFLRISKFPSKFTVSIYFVNNFFRFPFKMTIRHTVFVLKNVVQSRTKRTTIVEILNIL